MSQLLSEYCKSEYELVDQLIVWFQTSAYGTFLARATMLLYYELYMLTIKH